MAGIPSSLGAAAIMGWLFAWNRACEYSADRAGVLACGKPNKAVSALYKLEIGTSSLNQAGMQAVIQHLESDDEDFLHNLEETLASHPMVAKRIDEIRRFSSTRAFREMQSRMDQNLTR
jgi:Zn-dependent protease with chaperone function